MQSISIFKTRPQFSTFLESIDWSVNHLNQYTSRIHIHRDPATRLPTILGIINPLKNQKDWIGGELCLPQVGFVVNYEEADIVILKGSPSFAYVRLYLALVNDVK